MINSVGSDPFLLRIYYFGLICLEHFSLMNLCCACEWNVKNAQTWTHSICSNCCQKKNWKNERIASRNKLKDVVKNNKNVEEKF